MIGFNLTEEQKEMQAFFRKFSQERVKAAAEKMDEEEKMDMDLIHEMQSLGMFGIPFSEEVGGAGLDVFNYVLLMEELSKVDASTSITVSVHTSLCASSIEEFATPEQKEKWLRPLADGSKIGCFGLTEPDAGSDVAGARTVAVKDGDEYVINGSKIFTTNSGFADTFLVFALTDKAEGSVTKACLLSLLTEIHQVSQFSRISNVWVSAVLLTQKLFTQMYVYLLLIYLAAKAKASRSL